MEFVGLLFGGVEADGKPDIPRIEEGVAFYFHGHVPRFGNRLRHISQNGHDDCGANGYDGNEHVAEEG